MSLFFSEQTECHFWILVHSLHPYTSFFTCPVKVLIIQPHLVLVSSYSSVTWGFLADWPPSCCLGNIQLTVPCPLFISMAKVKKDVEVLQRGWPVPQHLPERPDFAW